MGYCFMHIEKIKTFSKMQSAYQHNYRMKFVQNAIPELEDQNEELVKLDGNSYEDAFNRRTSELGYGIDKSYRKGGVYAYEVLTSFSKEDREKIDIEKWKKDNIEWLRSAFNANPEKYGDNVLSVVYHGDEVGNVHCHAFIVPIDNKGRLNASYYTGDRMKYIEKQNSYAEAMKKHGLTRGIEGSVAKHEDIKRFYSTLNKAINIQLPEYEEHDTPETYREKIEELTKDMQASFFRQLKEKEREIVVAKSMPQREATIIRRKNVQLSKRVDELEREIGDLERQYGSMKQIKAMLKTTDLLNGGLKHYPDTDMVNELIQQINKLIEYEKQEREKEKAKEERESKRRKSPYEIK